MAPVVAAAWRSESPSESANRLFCSDAVPKAIPASIAEMARIPIALDAAMALSFVAPASPIHPATPQPTPN